MSRDNIHKRRVMPPRTRESIRRCCPTKREFVREIAIALDCTEADAALVFADWLCGRPAFDSAVSHGLELLEDRS